MWLFYHSQTHGQDEIANHGPYRITVGYLGLTTRPQMIVIVMLTIGRHDSLDTIEK